MVSHKYASLCSGVSSVFESTAVLNCDQNGAQSMRSPLKVGRWSLDHYAVAVLRDDVVVGHLPKKISRICSLKEGRHYKSQSHWKMKILI